MLKRMYGFEVTITRRISSTWTQSNINIAFNKKKLIISSNQPVEEDISGSTKGCVPLYFYTCTKV